MNIEKMVLKNFLMYNLLLIKVIYMMIIDNIGIYFYNYKL